jgi:hypothetical protein
VSLSSIERIVQTLSDFPRMFNSICSETGWC